MSDFYISSSSSKKTTKKKNCSPNSSESCSIHSQTQTPVIVTSGITSISLVMPSSTFSVSPVTITSSGTFAVFFNTQTPNTFFAGPSSGANAIPTWRSIVANDLPDLSSLNGSISLSQIEQGGATLSQVLSWNGSEWVPATVSGSVAGGIASGQLMRWNGSTWTYTNRRKYSQTGISGTTITLPTVPFTNPAVDLYINGLLKTEGLDYTIASNIITLSSFSLITTDNVLTIYFD